MRIKDEIRSSGLTGSRCLKELLVPYVLFVKAARLLFPFYIFDFPERRSAEQAEVFVSALCFINVI
jgi:hypothetical protein